VAYGSARIAQVREQLGAPPAQLLLALDREALLLLFSAVQFLLRLVLRSLPILFKLRLLPLCAFPLLSAQLLTALVGDTFLFVSLAV